MGLWSAPVISVISLLCGQTIGAAYGAKSVTVDGRTVVIGIWVSERQSSSFMMLYVHRRHKAYC